MPGKLVVLIEETKTRLPGFFDHDGLGEAFFPARTRGSGALFIPVDNGELSLGCERVAEISEKRDGASDMMVHVDEHDEIHGGAGQLRVLGFSENHAHVAQAISACAGIEKLCEVLVDLLRVDEP